VLKRLKLIVLASGQRLGLSRRLLDSRWRQRRLLILCYHGISLVDEHEWDPALFMPATVLRDRFECLRTLDCHLLGLAEALERLRAGTLPPRAVSVTFDDGTYDFLTRAMPLIREYDIPVTLFFATHHSLSNKPIYDLAVDYVLWRAQGQVVRLPEVFTEPVQLDSIGARRAATQALRRHAHARNLTTDEKDDLLARLAAACAVDMGAIRRQRLLHLMTPAEVTTVSREGIDVQLHTHRHRVYDDKARFRAAVEDNRQALAAMREGRADHFCYPGGMYLPEFVPWLDELGVRSGATCDAGLASQAHSPWLLPRLIDTATLSAVEFRAWVSGLASWLPKRPHAPPDWMLVRGPGTFGA